ncbi:hypothetical protein BCR37DRAFT_120181 [Protomyces lactucae-debilis]|uniref:G-protein coupled receptors family 1 profile domain-containing protein n=1 Tax=Protomyces lactucae-debilis TaxID=2754530 RepID=A0A1Y2F306_PROLT|nr:uncharacterized protein BCR37DRAFT_120181 [Protomyces lactucae-debilis]ORY77716.1 hypothetical protein BCR37DRAFT_120181 [Protomyces lactucae-debilis]
MQSPAWHVKLVNWLNRWLFSLTLPGPYFVVLLMTVISGLSSVIGINLVCVLIFGLSMEYEKWIYLAIYTLSIIAPTPSVLLGHYGYDPLRDDCWISLPAGVKRTLVTVCSGFLVPWIFATISVGSTIWIIVFLSKHRQINRLFLADGETNRTKVRRMILKVLLFPITNTFFILLLTICELVVDQQLISQNGGHKENGGLHFIIAIGAVMTALVLGIELLLVDPSFNLRVILDAFRKEEDLDECSSASQRSSEPRARVTSTMGRLALRIENTTSVEMDILETKSPVRAV